MVRVELYLGDGRDWNAFARLQRGYTHFHRHEWRGVMERVLGHECIYLAARSGAGALEAVLPLVRVKSMIFGHYVVSMPFLNYGGPLGSREGLQAVVDEAIRLARADQVKLLELRSRIELPIDLPVSHRKITVLLPLDSDTQRTFKSFDAKLRSQIRRPQKAGMSVKAGPDQVDNFFSVFASHMRDLGTPTQSKRLFEAIAETFPEDAVFACTYAGDRPIAAGCGFRFGDEFEMTWASSLREYNRDAPNMLLYWSMMERAAHTGIKTFNFGRCTPGSGTHRFKTQWGGQDEALWWYGLSREGIATTPSADHGAFSWGPRVWRRLPRGIATVLGPRIVRFIP